MIPQFSLNSVFFLSNTEEFTLPLATGVPDEERSIERDTRRGGRERGERRERREGLA